jgi:hypothetical protein
LPSATGAEEDRLVLVPDIRYARYVTGTELVVDGGAVVV